MQKEVMPLYSMVLIEPYLENPYEVKETEEGLRLTTDMQENPDTGELDKKDFFIVCGKVKEVGPDCKFVKPGDDVMYDARCVRPIRFMGNVFVIVAEQNIATVISEGLSERFGK